MATHPMARRRCGHRSPSAASAPAISMASPRAATIANRVGVRTALMTGT